MRQLRYILLLLIWGAYIQAEAQVQYATIRGNVTDERGSVLANVSVIILGRTSGVLTTDSGMFQLRCPANKAFAIVFSHAGFISQKKNFLLKPNEQVQLNVQLLTDATSLETVTITREQDRTEAGRISFDAENILNLPSPITGIESMIKVFVGSNNELTSQYAVRGGNYDENLVYVNDFEVFRPYLVRSGQQEGLSFINPELTRNVVFYNGGFQAKYGDKLSSVLDIQYKKPREFAGSAYVSLLEQGVHIEGTSADKKFTYLTGIRNRSNRNILKRQETQGNYVPSSSDIQAQLTYRTGANSSLELLLNFARTRFKLIPSFSQLTSSVFSPYFSANLGMDIYFEGREDDSYHTSMAGLSFNHQPSTRLKLKWMFSRFNNYEREGIDITGAYLFGERAFDKSKPDFGVITNPLGAGVYQTYARNRLDISVWNLSHKGSLDLGSHYMQWGQSFERQLITDRLHEWEYQDSAGYALPYDPDNVNLNTYVRTRADFAINRITGYVQDNIVFRQLQGFSLQIGARYNFNDLNSELLISPRAGFSWKPAGWKKDIVLRGAVGAYSQPPFYRELRDRSGRLNTSLKAQNSVQILGGMDYQFTSNKRPFRLTIEAYYKDISRVVPYDIENLRIRYTGNNEARAYAAGIDVRLFGELVKDAESWVSIGFMRTRENLEKDTYFNYVLDTLNKPVDSSLQQGGWFRRPTDRLFNFGLFLQDYLATSKNFKVYLNLLYGSNMPFNIPGSIKYRNALVIDPYMRIDIGFSALLMPAGRIKNIDNIWATLEVFNLIDRDNTISYFLVKDFSNTRFAMPNRLTPRLLNFKIITRF